jgi:alpha-L-fucosidase
MKKLILFVICLVSITGINAQSLPTVEKRLEEWKDKRFGMFICWCTACLKGTEMGWSRGVEVPIEEYDNLYKRRLVW